MDNTTQKDKIVFNDKEYYINNIVYSDDMYLDGNVIGTAIAKTLQFSIYENIKLENKEIKYYTSLDGENYIFMGTFIVKDMSMQEELGEYKVDAIDYMIKLEEKYITKLEYNTKRIKIIDILKEISKNTGIELGVTEFKNSNYIVENNRFESNKDTTYREVIKAIAEISGRIAKIGKDDKLYMISLKSDIIKKINTNNYYSLKLKRKTHPINSVSLGLKDVDGENVTKTLEGIDSKNKNSIIINNNPFAYTQTKRYELIEGIFEELVGFEYTSYEMKTQFDPNINTGDKVEITNINGEKINSYVFRYIYKSPNGLESEIYAPSIINSEVLYENKTTLRDKIKNTEIKVDKIQGVIESLVEQKEDKAEELTKIKQDINEINIWKEGQYDFLDIIENERRLVTKNAEEFNPLELEATGGYLFEDNALYPSKKIYPRDTIYENKSIVNYPNKKKYPKNSLYPIDLKIIKKGVYPKGNKII